MRRGGGVEETSAEGLFIPVLPPHPRTTQASQARAVREAATEDAADGGTRLSHLEAPAYPPTAAAAAGILPASAVVAVAVAPDALQAPAIPVGEAAAAKPRSQSVVSSAATGFVPLRGPAEREPSCLARNCRWGLVTILLFMLVMTLGLYMLQVRALPRASITRTQGSSQSLCFICCCSWRGHPLGGSPSSSTASYPCAPSRASSLHPWSRASLSASAHLCSAGASPCGQVSSGGAGSEAALAAHVGRSVVGAGGRHRWLPT